jgi:hypothetical protein
MKTVIQSLNSGNYLIVDHSESGKVGYYWTNRCVEATGFDSDEEAVNTIKKFGFFNTRVVQCAINYEANGG